jgi:hypothetical protein
LASHISQAQATQHKSGEPRELICCPSVHSYDINEDLEASLPKSSSAPSPIDNDDSESDDEESDSNFFLLNLMMTSKLIKISTWVLPFLLKC